MSKIDMYQEALLADTLKEQVELLQKHKLLSSWQWFQVFLWSIFGKGRKKLAEINCVNILRLRNVISK
jgi:hypothetical protein